MPNPWGTGNSVHVGRCSRCGGRVTLPSAWWSVVDPVPTCESCGATAAAPGPVIDMDPPARTIATDRILIDSTPTSGSDSACKHGVSFDSASSRGLSSTEVRKRWPRLMGTCPLGCGWHGIYYASWEHYIAGDW